MEDAPVLSQYSVLRNPCVTPTGVWSIVVKEKPTAGSPFFGAFPSARIPNTTKDVSVHFFIHSIDFSKLYRRIPGTFLKLLRTF
jgi:hypothetical protein